MTPPPVPPALLDFDELDERPPELLPPLLALLLPPLPPLAVLPPLEVFPPESDDDLTTKEVPPVEAPPTLDELEEDSLPPADPAPPLELLEL